MLSIRTQDRMALVPYDNSIYIYETSDKRFALYCENGFRMNELGIYSSKERALEVLDEIEEIICDVKRGTMNFYDKEIVKGVRNNIYQMPKE